MKKTMYIKPTLQVIDTHPEKMMVNVSTTSLEGTTVGGEAEGTEEVDARWYENKSVWDD